MKRGVFVRGKAIDKVTGRPIMGSVNYYAFADNPNVREYAGFSESYEQHARIRRTRPVRGRRSARSGDHRRSR